MRFRHIFSETCAGLRQNLTMTLAVIMTMWVSLSLFGAGLLASQQVDLMKGHWYDKIEISVFLCTKDIRGEQCEPGQDATQAQKDAIRQHPGGESGGGTRRRLLRDQGKRRTRTFQKAYAGQPDPGLADRRPDAGVVPGQAEEPRAVRGRGQLGGRAEGRADGPGPAAVPRPVLQLAEPAAVGAPSAPRCCCCSPRRCRSATPSGWPPSPAGERSASCAWSARATSTSRCRSCSRR